MRCGVASPTTSTKGKSRFPAYIGFSMCDIGSSPCVSLLCDKEWVSVPQALTPILNISTSFVWVVVSASTAP